MEHLLVYLTGPNPDIINSIAKTVVEEHLAACANVLPGATSFYWWQGILESSTETVCLLKTTKKAYPLLETRIRTLHPYETPCIVALPFHTGFAPFLQWITTETTLPHP